MVDLGMTVVALTIDSLKVSVAIPGIAFRSTSKTRISCIILYFFILQTLLCFLWNAKAELQKQQQQFIAQKLMAAQRHVAVTQQPQPQKATIVYRSQPVPANDQPKSVGEGRQRSRSGRHHDGRYTSGKEFLHEFSVSHGLTCLITKWELRAPIRLHHQNWINKNQRLSMIILMKFSIPRSASFLYDFLWLRLFIIKTENRSISSSQTYF